MQIPTALDELVRDSRALLDQLRREFPDRQDFDRMIYRALAETLQAHGYERQTIMFTMQVIFGHQKEVRYAEIDDFLQ